MFGLPQVRRFYNGSERSFWRVECRLFLDSVWLPQMNKVDAYTQFVVNWRWVELGLARSCKQRAVGTFANGYSKRCLTVSSRIGQCNTAITIVCMWRHQEHPQMLYNYCPRTKYLEMHVSICGWNESNIIELMFVTENGYIFNVIAYFTTLFKKMKDCALLDWQASWEVTPRWLITNVGLGLSGSTGRWSTMWL